MSPLALGVFVPAASGCELLQDKATSSLTCIIGRAAAVLLLGHFTYALLRPERL
jgi:hypothetical protein